MKVFISGITVCDPSSSFHGKRCDIKISEGFIDEIKPAGKGVKGSAKLIEGKGLLLSPGFVDMRVAIGEPGYEYKEDLRSAAKAALAGGYTTILCLPTTKPTIQHKADVEFILRKSEQLPVDIIPYGAITKNTEGKDMNELYDMHLAGAAGFTDGNNTIMQSGVMERAMEYSKIFDAVIISHAEDKSISGNGQMHEGLTSTELGLKGVPSMAEELIVNRDIELAKYTKSGIHFSHISSAGSVELIRKARKKGIKVTCDVAVANLIWTDERLSDFDSNFKLNPPLRSADDRKALWEGIADGTIDCISSDHTPEDTEHKDLEFEYASHGMIQLQTAFALLIMNKPAKVTTDQIIQALTTKPRNVLSLDEVVIEEGSPASLNLISETQSWTFNKENNYSKSSNSPLLNATLKGKVVATITKNKLHNH